MGPRFAIAAFAVLLGLSACSATTPTGTPSSGVPSSAGSAPVSGTGSPAPAPSATEPGPATSRATTDDGGPTSGQTTALGPPARGTYTYAQEGATTFGAFVIEPDLEGTLEVGGARGARQRQVRTYSKTQQVEQQLIFGTTGVRLASFITRFATEEHTCDLDEPMLVIAWPARPGDTYDDTGRCGGLALTIEGVVLREETRTIDGRDVQTLVIRTVLDAEGRGLEQHSEVTAWVSPESRLIVRMVERSTGSFDGASFTQRRTDDLLSLTPA